MNTSNRKYVIELLYIFFIIVACKQNRIIESGISKNSEKSNLSTSYNLELKMDTFDFAHDSISTDRKYCNKENRFKLSVKNRRTCNLKAVENDLIDTLKLNDLIFLIETKVLIDPVLSSFSSTVLLKDAFSSKNHTLELVDTAGGATTFVLKDQKGYELKAIGAVPFKRIKFPIIDKTLQYITYTTSFEDGNEIHILHLATDEVMRLVAN